MIYEGLHNMECDNPVSATTQPPHMADEHSKLTRAGWSYRTNDRGWIIYRDPQSGRWHALEDAVSIRNEALN
jgi:hypothetical protein